MSRSPIGTPRWIMPRYSKNYPTRTFPEPRRSYSVQDNLNTHKPASLYEAFPAPEARRLVERFEWHYTPKHGSWLDLAEVRTQRLVRSVPRSAHPRQADPGRGSRRLGEQPQQDHTKADWQFTTANARVKLKRLYPHYE